MGLKEWINGRKEKRESQKRFEELNDEELQRLQVAEKKAYLGIAKKQVTYRGKINAYKDFPINDAEKLEIDNNIDDDDDTEDTEDTETEGTVIEEVSEVDDDELEKMLEKDNEVKKSVFKNIR